MAYENTTVTVSTSQEAIRTILRNHGAARVNFGEDFGPNGAAKIGVEFVYADTLIRMLATIVTPDAEEVEAKASRSRSKTAEQIASEWGEQELKRMWRVLHWAIKVRMEAVEEGLETFEQAFLAHVVDPRSGRTLWDSVAPAIAAGHLRIDGAGLPALAKGS